MMSDLSGVYNRMFQLRKTRREFVGDTPGVFYRNQKLLALIRSGVVTEENIDEYMTKERMSENGVPPMEWYYLECFPKPEDIQHEQLMNNLHCASKKHNARGKLTNLRLRKLLFGILQQRVDQYLNPEKYMNNKILCIVGESGAGKTLASLHLQNKLGANVICSFTTRPPRPTEVEGREHHFVNIVPDPNDMLAYTNFGGYDYFALKSQVWGDCTVYVVDEDGLRNLKAEHGDKYRLFSVYITRPWSLRLRTGIRPKRMERDSSRILIPKEEYDWVIENNSTKKNLFINIEAIYNEVKNK